LVCTVAVYLGVVGADIILKLSFPLLSFGEVIHELEI
jgi:hypothetical protein